MGQMHEEARTKIKAVLGALSQEERRLFAEVYKIEQMHLHNKNAAPTPELVKKLKELVR